VTSTNLRTEFLLQFRKQWEDSAILLASNRPQQQWQDKETKNDRKGKKKLKERTKQGKTKNNLYQTPIPVKRQKISWCTWRAPYILLLLRVGGILCLFIGVISLPLLKSRCKNPPRPIPRDLHMFRFMIMFTLCSLMGNTSYGFTLTKPPRIQLHAESSKANNKQPDCR
jgi:hypothetical protein